MANTPKTYRGIRGDTPTSFSSTKIKLGKGKVTINKIEEKNEMKKLEEQMKQLEKEFKITGDGQLAQEIIKKEKEIEVMTKKESQN